jgi:hypothetical protein
MAKNKLTTLGYFTKRLRDSGFAVQKVYNDYSDADSRQWTVVIDPQRASVMCTCYVNDADLGDTYFELYDGRHYVPGRFLINTHSVEIIIEKLIKFGIDNKNNPPPKRRYEHRNDNRHNSGENRHSSNERRPSYNK